MLRPCAFGALLALLSVGVLAPAGCRDRDGSDAQTVSVNLDDATLKKRTERLRKENERLQSRLDKLIPKDPYIVVNTTENKIYLRKGEQNLVEAVCSTGSNTQLTAPDGKKTWYFSTPHGVFKVLQRRKNPVWAMPEWGVIEAKLAGEEVTSEDLFQEGVLGEYALMLGDGYMIHGTLFQRFLGLPVTHGCIRVGDEALQKIWDGTKVGTPVYIF